MWPVLVLLAACWGDNAYIVEGTVVEVHGDREVVVQHEEIKGLMGAMTMPFEVRDPAQLEGVVPGDRIYARYMIEQDGSWLDRIRVTGKGQLPAVVDVGPAPLRAGELLPRTELVAEDGSTLIVGEGQGKGTALAFLYTRCPMPEFCPALVARFQALQEAVGTDGRLVAVTIDPDHDTLDVLKAFGENAGAKPETWRFARAEAGLGDLAGRASLSVVAESGEIMHGARMLVLDADGRLIERYDDNRWPLDRVAEQIRTGGPPALPGMDGTITP